MKTENFTFSPENSGKTDLPHEGHAHLYVNDKKVGRLYGPWSHLTLPKRKNTVRVTLNTNGHKTLYAGDKPIEAIVEVSEDRAVKDQHLH